MRICIDWGLRHILISARGKEASSALGSGSIEEGALVMASGVKIDKDPTVIELKEFQENFKVA